MARTKIPKASSGHGLLLALFVLFADSTAAENFLWHGGVFYQLRTVSMHRPDIVPSVRLPPARNPRFPHNACPTASQRRPLMALDQTGMPPLWQPMTCRTGPCWLPSTCGRASRQPNSVQRCPSSQRRRPPCRLVSAKSLCKLVGVAVRVSGFDIVKRLVVPASARVQNNSLPLMCTSTRVYYPSPWRNGMAVLWSVMCTALVNESLGFGCCVDPINFKRRLR